MKSSFGLSHGALVDDYMYKGVNVWKTVVG